MYISFVDDETSSNSGKHVVMQLLEYLVEEVELECHLTALAIRQHKVRIVTVGTDIYNLIRGDSHQVGAGRYSEPFQALTGLILQIYTLLRKVSKNIHLF